MKKQVTRNAALAFVGLLALSIYILACTSFSPDDTKVLYPAFDASSGAIGMAVYDRETRRSEMLFVPVAYQGAESNLVTVPSILRAEWLSGGREIVVAYTAPGKRSSDQDSLGVALVPFGVRKPFKIFRVPDVKDAAELFMTPLCMAGERVFLNTSSKGVARLDLSTGTLTGHEFELDEAKGRFSLYPAPDGASVFYLQPGDRPAQTAVFGRLNADDFSRQPLMVITNDVRDESVITYDKSGRVLVLLSGGSETNDLLVLRDGQRIFSRSLLTRGQERHFGNAILAANGKALWATFEQTKGTNSIAYGLMEVPFSDAPPRELTLINGTPGESSVLYFQAAISHDSKTAAIASTYLASTEKEFNPADCALFLVDLNDPKWPVTKVPIPMPPRHADFTQ